MAPEKETGRVEAFSDAVFAIAITLLALELRRPILQSAITGQVLWIKIVESWPSFLTFFISFSTVLTLWVNHSGIFESIHKVNRPLLFANGFLLMLIAMIPFTTALLTDHFSTPAVGVATAIYAGVFTLINTAYIVLWHVASHDRTLLKPGISERTIIHLRNVLYAGVPAYALAFVFSFFNYGASLIILVFMWLYWALQRRSSTLR
jgi:uncharacterized membrane protein